MFSNRMNKLVFLVCNAMVFFCLLSYPAIGYEPSEPIPQERVSAEKNEQTQDISRLKDRWKNYPKEKQKLLYQKYREFKSRPESDRKRIRDQHNILKIVRENLSNQEKDKNFRVDKLEKAELDKRVRSHIRKRTAEITKKLGCRAREGSRKLRRLLDSKFTPHIDRFLKKMEKDELITTEEREKIKALPIEDRRDKIMSLWKKDTLRAMDGLLPEDEMAKFSKIDPWRFHRNMLFKKRFPPNPMVRLTREQMREVNSIKDPSEREKAQGKFVRTNLIERLKRFNVDQSEIDKLLSLPDHEKFSRLMQLFKKIKKNPDVRKKLFNRTRHGKPNIRTKERPGNPPPRGPEQRRIKRKERNGQEKRDRYPVAPLYQSLQ